MNAKSLIYTFCPRILRPIFARVENSSIGYRLAKGMFWSLAGAAVSRGLMLVAAILVARVLGKIVYGEFGMIQSTVGMFGVFAGFGLGLTATKYVAECRSSDPGRAGRILGLSGLFALVTGSIMALGLFLFAPWIAQHIINAPHLTSILRIGAGMLFISALNGAQTGALSGFEAFKAIACVNLFVGLISFPILLVGAYFFGLTGAAWALTLNLCFNLFFNHLALRKEIHRYKIPFSFRKCEQELSVLWRFSLPAVLAGSLVGPVNWACSALLVNQPDGYGEMGIFSAANQWRMAILFIPSTLGQVVLPLLANLNADSTGKQFRKVLKLNIFLNSGITLAVVIPLFFLAHLVMSAYGIAFKQGVIVLRLLAFSAVLMAANDVVGQAISSKGKMWVGFMFNAFWALVLLASTSILIEKGYGAFGLACATFIAYLFHTTWQGLYIARILRRTERP
jgi:O-antigen/teichoic acid export membrane protein